MNKQTDVLLATAGSVWSAATTAVHDAATFVAAYGPAALTIIYIAIKIYYKVKRERQRDYRNEIE